MTEKTKYTGLWIGKLGNANSWYHIYPFASASNTDLIHVVRHSPPFYEIPNSKFYHYHTSNPIVEFLKLYWYGRRIIRKNKIDYIVTFNPYPWGIAAWLLARQFSIPISVGLIGKDFDIGLKKSVLKKFLKRLVLKSDFVTITGNDMRPFLEDIGVKSNQIGIFPHCIKDDWFTSDDDIEPEYDIITVCELIERKRIDDIIKSVHILKQDGHEVRCCIVGDGPLMNDLKNLTRQLKLSALISFTGYTKDVFKYLKKSKIYVQASRQEGLSISLIEAIATGLVPISTIAGSEEDIIENGKNGFLVNIGCPGEIANAIEILLKKTTFDEFRQKVLETRKRFRIGIAIEAASRIIEQISSK